MNEKVFITTAIPYANAAPHIGTAMDYLYGDILLRYYLARRKETKLSIGTDEHGTKVERKAADNSLTPQQYVDNLQSEFQEMRIAMNLDFGASAEQVAAPLADQNFGGQRIINVRTTDPDHVRRAQAIWQKLDAAGVIYKGTYEGWYCSGCENFLTDTEAKEMNYVCPDHSKDLEKLSEENYYLRASQFTEEIRQFARESIVPTWRGKEILELIKDGAQDVSISRPKEKLAWGIEVPGDASQVMYVWVDALSNYITSLGFPDDNWHKDYWPAEIEIVGKDILRFHAIIWPAMLLALKLELPHKLMVHGHINVGGSKMSKSVGNVVSPLTIIDEYGADAFRYYFTRHIPTFDDGDFTWEKFEQAYNGELANDLGNLVNRAANMTKKYCHGALNPTDHAIGDKTILDDYTRSLERLELNKALDYAWEALVQSRNAMIDNEKPWEVAKENNPEGLQEIMEQIQYDLLLTAEVLRPFLPETSVKIHKIFSGKSLPDKIPILFPKIYNHTPDPRATHTAR